MLAVTITPTIPLRSAAVQGASRAA
jgi:hypothetical protein